MAHSLWEDLPDTIRTAVTRRVGQVFAVIPAQGGAGAKIVATLHTPAGRVFLKAVRLDGSDDDAPRVECRVQTYLPQVAPRLLAHAETDGWLLLLFEYADGRHADLSPGSPDLPAVATVLSGLSQVHRPDLPVLPVERRWEALAERNALRLLRGTTLAHMDLAARNILIGERPRVVDWARPAVGAAWLDTAAMVVRLIQAGHTPEQAEQWAQQVPAWQETTDPALSVYIQARSALCRQHAHAPLHRALARWQAHRSTTPPPPPPP